MKRREGPLAEQIAATLEPILGPRLLDGNRIELLGDSPSYFAALLADIAAARTSVDLETYIFADDRTGAAVAAALEAAARRGVRTHLLIDSFGGGDFARRLRERLEPAGVRVRIFRPHSWFRPQRQALRRLHRKLVVIDERIAYVGGINVDDDPERDALGGEPIGPRFDFAVRCQGPVVGSISYAVRRLWWAVTVASLRSVPETPPAHRAVAPLPPPATRAALLLRDNLRHRRTIERAYLQAIAGARWRILISNAYFLPGRRFRLALVAAARRGVQVTLLLQGRVEYPLQHFAQRALYGQLLKAGIAIHEYRSSYLHAKVAVVDGTWATVGSSNIDPLSLLMAREANVLVRDAAFASRLAGRIEEAVRSESVRIDPESFQRRSLWTRIADWLAFGIVRAITVVAAPGIDY